MVIWQCRITSCLLLPYVLYIVCHGLISQEIPTPSVVVILLPVFGLIEDIIIDDSHCHYLVIEQYVLYPTFTHMKLWHCHPKSIISVNHQIFSITLY